MVFSRKFRRVGALGGMAFGTAAAVMPSTASATVLEDKIKYIEDEIKRNSKVSLEMHLNMLIGHDGPDHMSLRDVEREDWLPDVCNEVNTEANTHTKISTNSILYETKKSSQLTDVIVDRTKKGRVVCKFSVTNEKFFEIEFDVSDDKDFEKVSNILKRQRALLRAGVLRNKIDESFGRSKREWYAVGYNSFAGVYQGSRLFSFGVPYIKLKDWLLNKYSKVVDAPDIESGWY